LNTSAVVNGSARSDRVLKSDIKVRRWRICSQGLEGKLFENKMKEGGEQNHPVVHPSSAPISDQNASLKPAYDRQSAKKAEPNGQRSKQRTSRIQ
jgi:hypothetical protein